MKWYDSAVFYHIYPLGLCGAPKENNGELVENRLKDLREWIPHIKKIGCNAIYLGPVFESVGHGYETTDYKQTDRRLGTNEDLRTFVDYCHESGIKVVFDGVFNHCGRRFFAFEDVKKNRENSRYKDWFCNLNFGGNNEYNDGFSYDNWGGYNLLVKYNQRNPEVIAYLCDVIRYWVQEFNIDGIRLDAADVLDFEFMGKMRETANEIKEDFWLMGEVIHGDYSRWVNESKLHSVTDYQLHKALYSGHNDHNYFEIAHNIKRIYEQVGFKNGALRLYNFTDNHDVDRLASKLKEKKHLVPVYYLLYTLPGVPSIYYGSEAGIEGIKQNGSDDGIRPQLELNKLENTNSELQNILRRLGKLRQESSALAYGKYEERLLTNRQFAFARVGIDETIITAVNNDEQKTVVSIPVHQQVNQVIDCMTDKRIIWQGGEIKLELEGSNGRIIKLV